MPSFSAKSLNKVRQCHPDLQRVLNRAIKVMDFTVLEGHRSPERQLLMHSQGHSKALPGQSPHNYEPSLAVDIAPWPIDWEDKGRFYRLAGVMEACAKEEQVDIEWGGDFKSFFDGPHFQLKGWKDLK